MKKAILTTMILIALLLVGCGGSQTTGNIPAELSKDVVQVGDKIKVHYIGTLDDGTEFDSSVARGEPMEFAAGVGQMIPGFDAAVIGMAVGEKKTINIPSEEAYGEYSAELIQKVPHDQFPESQTPELGMALMLVSTDGRQIPATITLVEEDGITIDMNHELAGKNLNFQITLVSIL